MFASFNYFCASEKFIYELQEGGGVYLNVFKLNSVQYAKINNVP